MRVVTRPRASYALASLLLFSTPASAAVPYEIRQQRLARRSDVSLGSDSPLANASSISSSGDDRTSKPATLELIDPENSAATATTSTAATTSPSLAPQVTTWSVPPEIVRPPNQTETSTATSTGSSDTGNESASCRHYTSGEYWTVYSTFYTTTTTYYGQPEDYTPPYPTIDLPIYCDGFGATSTLDKTDVFPLPMPSISYVTFITTDKNPQVVFSAGPKPGYSRPPENDGSDPAPGALPGHHVTAAPSDNDRHSSSGPPRHVSTNPPTFTITAGPDTVVIGTKTISNLRPGQTTTVDVDGGKFTIGPTAVIGEGQTLIKPAPPPQIRTTMHGMPFSASGSVVAIDGTTMTVPEGGLSTVVNGEAVSISPGMVVFGSNDPISWPMQNSKDGLAVAGGERVTAIGPTFFVIKSTTITYGPDTERMTTQVDDDTITIGPSGVTLESTTLLPSAGETAYAFIGGVTVSRSKDVIVVNGKTFHVDGKDITTIIGGELLTIGRDGVKMSSMTLGGDRDRSSDHTDEVVATFEGERRPTETGSEDAEDEDDDDEDDGAGALSPYGISAGLTVLAFFSRLLI